VLAGESLLAVLLRHILSEQTAFALLRHENLRHHASKLLMTKEVREAMAAEIFGFGSKNASYFSLGCYGHRKLPGVLPVVQRVLAWTYRTTAPGHPGKQDASRVRPEY
jgi:hypothetical protein